jgi:hypothetical protein
MMMMMMMIITITIKIIIMTEKENKNKKYYFSDIAKKKLGTSLMMRAEKFSKND